MQDINAPVVVAVVVDVVVGGVVVVLLLLLKVPVPTFCMYVSLYSDILRTYPAILLKFQGLILYL